MAALVKIEAKRFERYATGAPRSGPCWPKPTGNPTAPSSFRRPIRRQTAPRRRQATSPAHARILGIPLAWREFPFESDPPDRNFIRCAASFTAARSPEGVMGPAPARHQAGALRHVKSSPNLPARATLLAPCSRVTGPSVPRPCARHAQAHSPRRRTSRRPTKPPSCRNCLQHPSPTSPRLDRGLEKIAGRDNCPPHCSLDQFRACSPIPRTVKTLPYPPLYHRQALAGPRWEVLRLFFAGDACRPAEPPLGSALPELAVPRACRAQPRWPISRRPPIATSATSGFDAEFDRSLNWKFSVIRSRPSGAHEHNILPRRPRRPPAHRRPKSISNPPNGREWRVPRQPGHELRVRSVQVKEIVPLPPPQR